MDDKKGVEAFLAMVVSAERLYRAFSDAVLMHLRDTGFEMNFAQAMVLLAVSDGWERPRDMYDNAMGQGTNVFHSMKFLENSGYIERRQGSEEDKRASRAVLTPAGRKAAAEIRKIMARIGDRRRPRAAEDDKAATEILSDALADVLSPNLAVKRD